MPTSILKHLRKMHLSCMRETFLSSQLLKKNYQELKGSGFVISFFFLGGGKKYFRSSHNPLCWFQVYILFNFYGLDSKNYRDSSIFHEHMVK